MGANAQTSVPAFTTGQVLTATQVTQINTGVPVFADSTARTAAFGGTGEKVLAQGQLSYLESDGKIYVYNGTSWVSISSVTNVTRFTASGTFTPPTGVTYAIAHILAGGGGVGTAASGNGGDSSVAFAGGTVTATGGLGMNTNITVNSTRAGQANSGIGAVMATAQQFGSPNWTYSPGNCEGGNGAYIVAGGAVTAGVGITVTVGAGGVAGTTGAAGGSGYVWIEYQV